jgi:hypothetical protein
MPLSDTIFRAVAIAAGLEIVGAGAQFVGSGLTLAVGAAAAATIVAGATYPKKYEVTNMTTGIIRRPHETISISLNDKYTIKDVVIRPKKMCEFTLSGALSITSKSNSATKNAIVTHTG